MSALVNTSIGASAPFQTGSVFNAQTGVISAAVSEGVSDAVADVVADVVAEVVAEVVSADRTTLTQQWHARFHRDPPAHVQVAMMRRVLAWHAQHQASPFAAKGMTASSMSLTTPPRSGPTLSPGTRLLREWQGATHEVLVLPQGFDYLGKTFSSLSAVARAITGTAWSGPAFFGIKR